jgi:putative transcriptional regulator
MPRSLAGHFLIAGRQMRDPNFFKTVVLLVEHGAAGAMGLVINRPSEVSITRALEGHFELPESSEVVFRGGPVERAALFILHDSELLHGDDGAVVPGLYVGSSAEVFEQVVREAVRQEEPRIQFRIFAGCAGWAPKQLEGELARGDWIVVPASREFVLSPHPYEVWDELMKRIAKSSPYQPKAGFNAEWN